jgi:hypothetical protein
MKTMYWFQEADLKEALDGEHESWFISYEMSLGKTLVSVEYYKAHPDIKTVIVVLPLNTRKSWEKEIESQAPGTPVYRLENTKDLVANFGYLKKQKPGWYLIGWELMRSGAITGSYADLIIADETHKQANYGKSDTSIFIQTLNSKYKLALSGTPAANKPEGIFATLNWLWPEKYSSYWKWVQDFFYIRQNGAVFDIQREKKPGSIIADIPMFSRRLVRDHREDMPTNMPEVEVEVEITAKQRHIYDQYDTEAVAWLGDEVSVASLSLTQEMRKRQAALGVPMVGETGKITYALDAQSSKIEKLIEITTQSDLNDQTFLVLVHSAQFIPTVVHQLNKKGIKAAGFFGETPMPERERLLEELGDTYRVLVAGIAAIAEGTDGLQYKCHNGVWLSKHPNALLNTQAKGRLDRPGQEFPINWWNIYAVNTSEEEALERLEEIRGNLEEVIDYVA